MTVIVAARTRRDGIVVASDSELTNGWQKAHTALPKVWTEDERVLGFAGSVRAGQIVRHMVEWPDMWPDLAGGFGVEDVERFAVKALWPAIRYALESNGALHAHRGVESIEAEFLIAYGDTLFTIETDGAVIMPPTGRIAIGSGYAEALGALGDSGPWTREQVIDAARRARISAVGVSGPIHVVSTNDRVIETVDE
jgi:ATP-dependent protease HslVU (ClpYQ) peptidase subunit